MTPQSEAQYHRRGNRMVRGLLVRAGRAGESGLATGLKVAAALIPVPIFALFLVLFIRLIRTMDELERRIQLEALAIAYPLTVLLLMTLGLLQRAVHLKFEDWSYAPCVGVRGALLLPVHSVGGAPLPMKNRLKVLRAERDWWQADLAERLEVSRQTVNAIETGRYDPSLPLAFRLAEVFETTIEAIFEPDFTRS